MAYSEKGFQIGVLVFGAYFSGKNIISGMRENRRQKVAMRQAVAQAKQQAKAAH